MTKIEIQKALYKQRPTATLCHIRKGIAVYICFLPDVFEEGEFREYENGVPKENTGKFIHFNVPVNDMGDASFSPKMDAKLLGRWVVPPKEKETYYRYAPIDYTKIKK
jgi:hypothetical protein